MVGLSLIPAFATLYQRLTLPESTRFIASQNQNVELEDLKKQQAAAELSTEEPKKEPASDEVRIEEVLKKKAHFKGTPSSNASGARTENRTRVLDLLFRMAACQDVDRHLRLLVSLGHSVRHIQTLMFKKISQMHISQILRHQLEPKCRTTRDRVRWQDGHCMGEAVQGFDWEYHHHSTGFRPW